MKSIRESILGNVGLTLEEPICEWLVNMEKRYNTLFEKSSYYTRMGIYDYSFVPIQRRDGEYEVRIFGDSMRSDRHTVYFFDKDLEGDGGLIYPVHSFKIYPQVSYSSYNDKIKRDGEPWPKQSSVADISYKWISKKVDLSWWDDEGYSVNIKYRFIDCEKVDIQGAPLLSRLTDGQVYIHGGNVSSIANIKPKRGNMELFLMDSVEKPCKVDPKNIKGCKLSKFMWDLRDYDMDALCKLKKNKALPIEDPKIIDFLNTLDKQNKIEKYIYRSYIGRDKYVVFFDKDKNCWCI